MIKRILRVLIGFALISSAIILPYGLFHYFTSSHPADALAIAIAIIYPIVSLSITTMIQYIAIGKLNPLYLFGENSNL